MKPRALLVAALLISSTYAVAGEGVRIDIFLADDLKQSVALVGPNSSVKFSPEGLPDTTLELRLIAPEPVIFDLIETTAGDRTPAVVGRIKLPVPGASVAVAGLKAAGFHQPYVLVRRD